LIFQVCHFISQTTFLISRFPRKAFKIQILIIDFLYDSSSFYRSWVSIGSISFMLHMKSFKILYPPSYLPPMLFLFLSNSCWVFNELIHQVPFKSIQIKISLFYPSSSVWLSLPSSDRSRSNIFHLPISTSFSIHFQV